MADKSPRKPAAKQPTTPKAPAAAERVKPPPAPPAPAQGLMPNLGVKDETKEFGPLASRDRTDPISGVVVHRTESPTMESTRNSYRTQIKNGNHVGAHYLVGKEGETSLTVPTDKVAAHVRGNKDAAWKGANARTVGIENVGMPTKIDPAKDVRKQVEAMSLPPAMRARLLGLDDKALKLALKHSDNEMHGDITGPQKRSNWNLVSALATTHGFDVGRDVQAHETVDHKTLGEGEPIKEFLTARQSYPARVAAAEQRAAALALDPNADPAQVEAVRAAASEARATMSALAADGTAAENNALEGEKIAEQPGPATERETERVAFYNNFWARSQALDQAIAP